MKYYILHWSLNSKHMGKLPQVTDVIHNCHVFDEPKFIDQFQLVKVEGKPIVSFPVLHRKAKLTDVIQAGGMGFSLSLVISSKLKTILEKYPTDGFQFFPLSVFSQGIEHSAYWLLHPYQFKLDVIDFSKSEVIVMEMALTRLEQLEVNNLDDFLRAEEQIKQRGFPYGIHIDKLVIKENAAVDFFALRNIEGGVKFFVSETLKDQIEKAQCTGIEFRPSELSFNEWVVRDGPRDQIYGRSW